MYRTKYIDAEEVYRKLATELNLELKARLPKVKVFVQPGRAYAPLSKRKVFVWDEGDLRHELTHILFYQLSRSAPEVLQEGVATYKQANTYPQTLRVGLDEIVEFEANNKDNKRRADLTGRGEGSLYQVSSAWAGDLIETYGIEKFKEFYRLCTNKGKIRRVYERVYGKEDSKDGGDSSREGEPK